MYPGFMPKSLATGIVFVTLEPSANSTANRSISGGGESPIIEIEAPGSTRLVDPRVQLRTVRAADDPQFDLEPIGISVHPWDRDCDLLSPGENELQCQHTEEHALRRSQPRRNEPADRS